MTRADQLMNGRALTRHELHQAAESEHIARRTHTFTVSPEPRSSGSELPRNNRSATKRGQWHILDTAVTIGDCRAKPPHCTHYYATRTRHAARCIRA
jgi:hypothetical protein